jgi:hypothetical protein
MNRKKGKGNDDGYWRAKDAHIQKEIFSIHDWFYEFYDDGIAQ